MPSLPTILLILAAFSIGATVIAAVVAIRSSREANSAIFPIVKEEEMIKSRRARISIVVWLSVTALFLGGWLAAIYLTPAGESSLISEAESGQTDEIITTTVPTNAPQIETAELSAAKITGGSDDGPSSTETAELSTNTPESATEPTVSPTPVPPTATSTPTSLPPTATPTNTATTVPTVTPTATPTPTPTPTTLADAARVPTSEPRTPAPPGVRMGPIQFGTEVTDDIEIVNPGTAFSEDIKIIYAVYPFNGMSKGLDFAVVWYHNGVELAREETQWQFGDHANSYNFLRTRGPGLYKLELYVNDSVLATKLFEIREN